MLVGPSSGRGASPNHETEPRIERIAESDKEIVALIQGVEHRRLFKLLVDGDDAGLVRYVEDPITRSTKGVKQSVRVEPDGKIRVPGESFTDLIVRSDPFVVAPEYDHSKLVSDSGDEESPAPTTTSGVSTASSDIERYNRFRQRKKACQYHDFGSYTHLYKGVSFTLSKRASAFTFGGLSSAICFVATSFAGSVLCGAFASAIIATAGRLRNFTVGLNDTDIGLPGFKSPFASLRLGTKYGAKLGETTPIALAAGHVERRLSPEVIFPSGYTP